MAPRAGSGEAEDDQDKDSAPHSEAIRAVLDELERDGVREMERAASKLRRELAARPEFEGEAGRAALEAAVAAARAAFGGSGADKPDPLETIDFAVPPERH